MVTVQPTIPGLEEPLPQPGTLVEAARRSIQARRDLGAIMPWHETLCAAVIELAEQVQVARGIAKAQLYAQMLAAEAKLPEPVVQETEAVVSFEGERIARLLDEYFAPVGSEPTSPGDPARLADTANAAPV